MHELSVVEWRAVCVACYVLSRCPRWVCPRVALTLLLASKRVVGVRVVFIVPSNNRNCCVVSLRCEPALPCRVVFATRAPS